VLVSALAPLAESVGVNRIVAGRAVAHPFGDPAISLKEEQAYRLELLETALAALRVEVDGPTVFEPRS
jgi:glycine/betaine/sarcosine/D-proline reductase family selenoprotein B